MGTSLPKILLVDDDLRLRGMLARYLQDQGFAAQAVADGVQMDRWLKREPYDLLLLDVLMPGEDGFAICRRLRASGARIPIIMLTARGDLPDRVQGLELGADDYLPKPFEPQELLARIHAVLRRAEGPPVTAAPSPGEVRFGIFRLELDSRRLFRGGEALALTSGEFALLHAVASHPWQPLSREHLLAMTHGKEDLPGTRGIDVLVSRLRRLIEEDPARPRFLQTVWGLGYVFVPDGKTVERP